MRVRSIVKAAAMLAVLSLGALPAAGFEKKVYDDAAFKAAQTAGGPVVVHVTAPWCPTCKAQHQALGELDKKYAAVTLFDVDFDSQKDVLKAFNASSQSTLIAFSGAKETGRLVGETRPAAIDDLIASTLKK